MSRRSIGTSLRALPLALFVSMAASAQNVELTGRVVDESGAPVSAAHIAFESLRMPPPPTPGVRSSYQLAQRLHLARTKLPRTITDRDGEWRVMLSPVQAALTTSGLSRFLMTVKSKDHAGWQRCISGDLRNVAQEPAVLVAKPSSPPLRIRFVDAAGADVKSLGCAFVERTFRVTGTRSIPVSELVMFEPDGTLAFDKAVRIPGEQASTRPVARAETYRVTIYAAGFEVAQRSLGPGDHTVSLTPSEWGDRPILAARAQPAAAPIRASYTIAKQTVEFEFAEARVALLGDIEPDVITTGSGPVELDSWDPDLPLFVMTDANATETTDAIRAGTAPTGNAAAALAGTVELVALNRDGAPIYGAAVWIEDRAVKRASEQSDLVAVTDARGKATLKGLPVGTFSLLVRHPEIGFAEALADVRDGNSGGARVEARLLPMPSSALPTASEPLGDATILLDLAPAEHDAGASDTETVSVGMFDGGRRLEWFRMPGSPRWVRLEGLPAGPTNYFVQLGDAPAHFVGGVIALPGDDGPAQRPLDVPVSKFVLELRNADDRELLKAVRVHLGDRVGRTGERASESLFGTRPREDGAFDLDVHVRGALWVQVEAEGFAAREVELVQGEGTVDAAAQRLVIELSALPEPEVEGEAADGENPPEPERREK